MLGEKLLLAVAAASAVACGVSAAAAAGSSWVPPPYRTVVVDQTFDHYNWQTTPATYKQRVLICDKYMRGEQFPVFFYTGNEGDIVSFYNNSGAVFEHAERFGALVVFAEHRYFGESLPLGPTKSYQDGKDGPLTVEQALADYAANVKMLKEQMYPGKITQVIAFGGSYGGMLAAFARMWWPNYFDGALAASAPLRISLNETSQFAFFEHVTTVAAQMTSSDLPDRARAVWAEARAMSAKGDFAGIQQRLRLCSPPPNAEYVEKTIFPWIRNAWATGAMVNYPYPTDFLGPMPAWPLQVMANFLVQGSTAKSPLEAMADAVGVFYNGTNVGPCFDIPKEFYVCADATGCGGSRTDPNARSWDALVCTEIALAVGTNGKTDMFPVDPFSQSWIDNYCTTTWSATQRPEWLMLHIDLTASSNIIYSNGLLDPWSVGGIHKAVPSRQIHTVWIEHSAHHLDLRASNPADPASVTQARKQEADIIGSWLA